jgi:hypothetical protein
MVGRHRTLVGVMAAGLLSVVAADLAPWWK